MAETVLVAMSGGVDSSVTALLLKQRGYDVVGAHMKLWDYVDVGGDIHKDGRCCTLDSITDCRFVCDQIGAPFYVLNMSSDFASSVIDNFVSEYKAGRTPNPCVRCNSQIKWSEFLRKAESVGCDWIATGHYATVDQSDMGRYRLWMGKDATRDQSYVLWGLSQSALKRTLMPLGEMTKEEVRQIALQSGLRTAEKKESREICFVADDDYRRFLRERDSKEGVTQQDGDIVHEDGRVLGRHEGTAFYTIGQRRGLGIAHPTPLYVQRIDVEHNRIIVSDDKSLYRKTLTADQVNWVSISPPDRQISAEVKIRYQHAPAPASVVPLGAEEVSIEFRQEQRAIAPGQSVVFYEGNSLLGGGVIREN